MSGKSSNEKTSDFWASQSQPLQRIKDAHRPHTHAFTHAHGGKCLLAAHSLYVLKSAQQFHIPLIAFLISSCELRPGFVTFRKSLKIYNFT